MGKRPVELRAEIERTRQNIGDTIDALRYKADVPMRVQESVKDLIAHARKTIFGETAAPQHRTAAAEPVDSTVEI
ncbi:MAG: DUF3618 domain-containing protein [Candidatus Tyrphobacter sp.]